MEVRERLDARFLITDRWYLISRLVAAESRPLLSPQIEAGQHQMPKNSSAGVLR